MTDRPMSLKQRLALAAVLMATTAYPASAAVTDYLIPCKVTVIKSAPGEMMKVVCKGDFTPPATPPVSASLTVIDWPDFNTSVGANADIQDTIPLGNPPGSTGYKVKGIKAPGGCSLILVKTNVVKAICWNSDNESADIDTPLVGSARIILVLTGQDANVTRYCANFGGTELRNDETLFKAKASAAPFGCEAANTTTTSTTSTTSTTDPFSPVCCGTSLGCLNPIPLYDCIVGFVGHAGAPGSVCDSSGDCVAPPGTPGDCCEHPTGFCFSDSASGCSAVSGSYHPSSVCLVNGMCSP